MRRALKIGLEQENYLVLLATHADEALDLAAINSPHMVILNLDMSGGDGFQVCKQLRQWSMVPIIAISSSDQEDNKIAALDLGADEYLVKPIGLGEMKARLRAIRRRLDCPSNAESSVMSNFSCQGLRIDFSKRKVLFEETEIHLTPREYDLLCYMANNADRVLTTNHLLDKFWAHELSDDKHTLRVHIANLRQKIEQDPDNPKFIITESRIGYRFSTPKNNGVSKSFEP